MPELDLSLVAYKMPRVLERLRAFLQVIGPGGVRAGLAILLGTLTLLVLSLAAVWFGLAALGREEAEREAGGEQYTISVGPQPEDFPLIFGPGPSPELAEAAPEDGRRAGIPGLSEMQVIGYLQHVPSTQFSCPERGIHTWVCTLSSTDGPAVYEVSFLRDGPNVFAVVATAYDASEDEAARVLGYVARISVGPLGPLDPESWVDRTISSGGQYVADGVEMRLYSTEQTKTLEIVSTVAPERAPDQDQEIADLIPDIPDLLSPELPEETNGLTPR